MTTQPTVPSREVLERATRKNAELGHENLGFLSEEHGLAPVVPPLLALPPSHRAWDDIVEQMPELWRSLRLRRVLDGLPLLSAAEPDLPDRYLLRASALLSMLAHSYVRVSPGPQPPLPVAIERPWQEVTARLGRRAPFLSYIDLIVYNWRFRDPTLPDPRRVENLDLLIPTVKNQDDDIFHLAQVEMLEQCAPVVGAVVRAQERIAEGDIPGIEREMLLMIERLRHVTEVSFQKIDPNRRGASFVDPVIWAKTVAPFAVPISPDVQGPSGTSSPLFHLFDVFLGRKSYDSILGVHTLEFRDWYPPHWSDFLAAVDQVSLRDFVMRSGNRHLQGLYQSLLDTYAGDKGLLGLHRLKVYGYLETAFKVGRTVTIGGFTGLFRERAWGEVDDEIGRARDERYLAVPDYQTFGTPLATAPLVPTATPESLDVRHVALDVSHTGIQYRVGDRGGVLAENSDELIDRTLRALRASGEETVQLDRLWQRAIQARDGYGQTTSLPLAMLLRFGTIRPVSREVARALSRLSASSKLREIVNARQEDQWELWDLLDLLYDGGFDTRRLWKAQSWEAESICKIVPPEVYRLYSIASAMEVEDSAAPIRRQQVDFVVRRLAYETGDSATSRADKREGSASNFLHRAVSAWTDGAAPNRISFAVTPSARFHLPDEPERPIVMFAGGAGIAPFRGFLQERTKAQEGGENWLFFGTRRAEELFFRDEFERWAAQRRLELRVAFSAADIDLRFDSEEGGRFVIEPGQRRRIDALIVDDEHASMLWDLLRSEHAGGRGAHFYVCGQTGFAVSVMRALLAVIQRFAPGESEEERAAAARETFYQFVAERRFQQDIFTTYSGVYQRDGTAYNASDVVLHNDAEHGYWFVIDGRVYDMTEFLHLHPGGDQIVRNSLGMDATRSYRGARHHLNPEVDAMLGMYEIGHIRRLRFGQQWRVAIGPGGLFAVSLDEAFRAWVRALYLIVEMENALASDFGIVRKVTTFEEEPALLTPYKIQFVAETHRRFLGGYLDDLSGADVQQLWAISSAFGAENEDVRHLQQALTAVTSTPDATRVRRLSDEIEAGLERLLEPTMPDPALFEQLAAVCVLVEEHDRRFLARLKLMIREGVLLFETHEAETAERAGTQLVSVLARIPSLVRDYYHDLAASLPDPADDFASSTTDEAADSAAPVRRRTAAEIRATRILRELPGHGMLVTIDEDLPNETPSLDRASPPE
jgi:sulfite reductase (NADPH) flavoprotein alpha-component